MRVCLNWKHCLLFLTLISESFCQKVIAISGQIFIWILKSPETISPLKQVSRSYKSMFSSKLQLRHQHCILTFQFRQPKVSHSKNPEIYRLEEKEETNTRKRKRTPENRVEMGKDIITKNHAKSHSIVLSMGLKKKVAISNNKRLVLVYQYQWQSHSSAINNRDWKKD